MKIGRFLPVLSSEKLLSTVNFDVSREMASESAYNTGMKESETRAAQRKRVGLLGESIAATYLAGKGFSIVERNYRRPWGEIDIIAEKGGVVRFVEVKTVSRETLPDVTRESPDSGYRPEEMVHEAKLRKVARTAELYMADRGDTREYQIDVVGVFLVEHIRKARCRLFEQVL
jgi:putative endonuclease